MKTKMTRREFMAAAGGTLVSIGLPGTFYKLSAEENEKIGHRLRPDGRPRIPPGQYPVKRLRDMGGIPGPGRVPAWRLKIYGEVDKPLSLTYGELSKFERVNRVCDVHCVTGWTLLDSRWGGIRLADLMTAAKVRSAAGFVIFESPGGYTSNIPITEARKENVILADTYENEPLPEENGAPLRALVPDLYFWKSAKWIEAVRFSAEDEPGYYERAGYSNSADPWKEERYATPGG